MLTVKNTTAQHTAPGLSSLIAWALGPKLKISFPNKQSTRTDLFFCSINNNPQSTEAEYLVCFNMQVNQVKPVMQLPSSLGEGGETVLNVISSKRRFLHMYTLPRQPRCITGLCNHCTFIYIFCSRAPEVGRRDGCQGKTWILQEWSPWPQEDGLKRGRRQWGGHQDSIPNASTAHPEQTFGTEF